jgi:L-ascorbate metabolism protein UlaG (beta-lactamase superfamily)
MALEISWFGRTSFRLRGRQGTVITDPVPADSGYKLGKVTADVVTLSQKDEPAYGNASLVGGDPRVLDAPGEYEVGGVLVTAIPLPLPEGRRNMAYLFEIEGIRICQLGAIAPGEKPSLPEELEDVDVLLMPVGDGPTLTAEQAADLMTRIDPSVIIPMLYKTEQERMELDSLDRFLSETGSKPEPQAKFTTTKAGLPSALTVVVLQPRTG